MKQFEGMYSPCQFILCILKFKMNCIFVYNKQTSFIGLCNDSINEIGQGNQPPPSPADLQGFWEMVYLQVEDVDSLFAELQTIRTNDWKVKKTSFT